MKRKGVSPVIATLLLIVIAVAAAVLTYIWVTGYMGRVTGQAETSQLQERIKIDAVSAPTGQNQQVEIYVANIGDIDVNITSAYVLDTGGRTICGGDLTTDVKVPKGETKKASFSGCNIATGTTYVAKVVTNRGVEATYTFTTP